MNYERWRGPNRPVPNGATVVRLAVASDADAPGHARAAFARLRGRRDDDVLERALLLTSELVMNSVMHAGGAEVRVDIWPTGRSIVVVVGDDGSGFAPVAQPVAITDRAGGFGLPLVDTLCEAWGSGRDDEAWVWFEVGPRVTAASAPVSTRASARGELSVAGTTS